MWWQVLMKARFISVSLAAITSFTFRFGKSLGTKAVCPADQLVWTGVCVSREMAGAAGAGLVARLESVPNVDIEEGTFKYILIKVSAGASDKFIVRGYERAGYHADIYDEVEPGIKTLGLTLDCVGGGRIKHMPKAKSIYVYGYSQGFGRADHSITTDILKKHFKGYASITWSNDGY